MSWLTILLFLVYTLGLGYSVTFFLKQGRFFERMTMRLGIGLSFLMVLGAALNLLHIPLDWRIFLALALLGPVIVTCFKLYKKEKLANFNHKLMAHHVYFALALIIFSFVLFTHLKGTFLYPYLEDDDSWGHVVGIKYAAVEKTLIQSNDYDVPYMDPYPPAYDFVLGLLHQTSDSMQWTLKFFNALFVSIGLLFFYFFMERFTGSRNKALFGTLVLASVPAFLSHFIWAHSIVPALIIVIFYCLEMLKEDRKWICPAGIAIASLFLSSIDDSVKFGIMFLIYFAVKSFAAKKIDWHIIGSLAIGSVLSLTWWGVVLSKYGFGFMKVLTGGKTVTTGQCLMKHIGPCGTGTRPYSISDFIFAKAENMITNPIGMGWVVSLLMVIGVAYLLFKYKDMLKTENSWQLITLLWFLFTFLGIHGGNKIPIALLSFRFWMLLAIPTAILAAEGLAVLFGAAKNIPYSKIIIAVIIVIGILMTSMAPKYELNTLQWSPGGSWVSMEELQGYISLKALGTDKKIFTYGQQDKVMGFDQFICSWCNDEVDFRKKGLTSQNELYPWLKDKGYEYFIFDAMTARDYSADAAGFIMGFVNNTQFAPLQQNAGFILFRVN